MKKRILMLICLLGVSFCLISCGENKKTDDTNNSNDTNVESTIDSKDGDNTEDEDLDVDDEDDNDEDEENNSTSPENSATNSAAKKGDNSDYKSNTTSPSQTK